MEKAKGEFRWEILLFLIEVFCDFFYGGRDTTRRAVRGCLFFALSQRIGEEKTLKGLMPLRNPQKFSLSLSFGGYQKAILHLQLLRNKIQRFCFYCKQASILGFTPVPRYKGKDERVHTRFLCCASSFAITRGRRNKRKFLVKWGAESRSVNFSKASCVLLPWGQFF